MPHVEKHQPGSFSWLELSTTNQEAAKTFYTSLFGWSVEDSPMGPNDFYSMFSLEGRNTGAAYTMRPDEQAQGIPPHWMVYVATDDADHTAQLAGQAGGKVLAPPFDVYTFGRMAVIQDPAGAVFSVWQSKNHTGAGIAGVPGTLCWVDLNTPNPESVKQFYTGVFGWKIAPGDDPSGYLHIKNGDEFIGGIPPASSQNPNAPPHWLPYILVADCDATTAKAKELGAQAYMEPMTIEHVGRMAVLADPQGAVFAIFQPPTRGE
jgi:predicted enzyme related to lactoylglutathione lyase